MTTQNSKVDDDDSLWFFMSKKGDPVDDFEADPTVNVVYAEPEQGPATSRCPAPRRSSTTTSKKRQLWSKIAEAWFPGGPNDPDLALVQVQIIHANYWDVKESKLVQLYEMAKAAITGKPPTDLGRHGEVRMN